MTTSPNDAPPRVALVTGGARGIGRAISLDLARRGFRVVINVQKSEALAEALAEEIRAAGGVATPVRADVADAAAVRAMFQAVTREHGRLDVLVNNAGVLAGGLFALTRPEDFWSVLAVNLGGVVHCCKHAIPLLARERRGRIVNIASISGILCNAGVSAYATSKAAVIALSKVLARELAPAGVMVNVVAPGLVDTDMTRGRRARSVELQPVARLGTPEEVARVVGFLADEAPAYLTGEVIRVDGGAAIG
jgi:3-oxoacyl-[acyl-carrier protein] reductase